MTDILRLYPQPAQERPLEGTILAHDLRQGALTSKQPYVYANFVASVDGRVAVQNDKGRMVVPGGVANERDWRLFQEMAAQADLVLITTRYLRDWAGGRSGEIFQAQKFPDLAAWRRKQGLSPQPDVAAISASLRATVPEAIADSGRKLVFITIEGSPPERQDELRAAGHTVLVAGQERVDGRLMKQQLATLGYRTVYLATGPTSMSFLLSSGGLDRLYLTMANRLLGGDVFKSIVDGPSFSPAVDLRLYEIYLDREGPDGLGQLFLSYDVQSTTAP